MRLFRRLWQSVFVKFSASFLLVGLVPLIALSIFSLQTFTGHVQQFTMNNLQQMSLYMSYNINNLFSDYDEISKLMYTGRYEGGTINTWVSQTVNVNEEEKINNTSIESFLQIIVSSDKHIRSAYFVRALDRKLYFQTKETTAFTPERLPVGEWMESLREQPNRLAIIPTHDDFYYWGTDRKVVTFGRNLIDISGNPQPDPKVVGTLFFDVDVAAFESLFNGLDLGAKGEIHVLDGLQRVFFSSTRNYGDAAAAGGGDDGHHLVYRESVPYINGQVILRIPRRDLFEQLTTTRTAVYIAIVFCTLVIVVMGMWFSKRLLAPIQNVLQHMLKVESGNLNTKIERYGRDEIGRLAHSFNRMVERLNAFINDAYVAQIKQKQAELNALKSQIRPHYLYNTLEVIRMNAVYNDDEEVAEMIRSLSNQLKYVIDYGEDWVTVRQELDHLQDYFYIIRVRYDNRIGLQVHVNDERLLKIMILKLSLQPIVENAVQHGIMPNGGRGSIIVMLEQRGDRLVVFVQDDGVGIGSERLAELMASLHDARTPAAKVGLKNVHERIRSACGEPYGVEIESEPGVGTCVRLTYPIRTS
ncbi:MAG: two-component sensor histidine kinase [Thermobacillus sp.]|uniref:cache domain-containing sensor histidine kinase n=1 Tax=Thermobacillus sp. TaxID=2108467 RepID=UPI000E37EA52|nr:sensor histidine kinase [Thermobacillus sp.]REK57527.1 MAG: two-component sensor histidine kinase [Thermobacillus sp.]